MIMIEYEGLSASWSSKSQKWVSTDKVFAEMLNRHLPDEDDFAVSIPFRTGGMDKIALDNIKDVLGASLNVIAFLPGPAPKEQKGILD